MIEIMQAHWLSVVIITFTCIILPFYWSVILHSSKAQKLGWLTAALAAPVATAVLFNIPRTLDPWGNLLLALLWIIPALMTWRYREYFKGLDQRNIISFQLFRFAGATFLIEMLRGNIPSSFALPAGIGDIMVGLLAVYLVLGYKEPPRWGVLALIIAGLLDFVGAFFFGITSFEGPMQLFAFGFENKTMLFPIGLIPLILVPYAITCQVISLINLKDSKH